MKYDNIEKEKAVALDMALKNKNVRIEFFGCGCCGSPDITIIIDDKIFLQSLENAEFSNLKQTAIGAD